MFYWVVRAVIIFVLKLLINLRIEGAKNIPLGSNFIVVANHTSFLDPLIIMASIPKKIYCVASRYLYKIRFLNWFLNGTQAFPSGASSQTAVELLMKNKIVGLFPEGKISRDGKLKSFRKGAVLWAHKTGRPVLPCAIIGAREALPLRAKFPRLFSRVKVKIGNPIYFLKEFEEIIDDILLQKSVLRIRGELLKMIYAG